MYNFKTFYVKIAADYIVKYKQMSARTFNLKG